jgi:hypothetical protein
MQIRLHILLPTKLNRKSSALFLSFYCITKRRSSCQILKFFFRFRKTVRTEGPVAGPQVTQDSTAQKNAGTHQWLEWELKIRFLFWSDQDQASLFPSFLIYQFHPVSLTSSLSLFPCLIFEFVNFISHWVSSSECGHLAELHVRCFSGWRYNTKYVITRTIFLWVFLRK